MRGEHYDALGRDAVLYGIIPACAGSTDALAEDGVAREDHPRMRGEHVPVADRRTEKGGIIPACAGSTMPASACGASGGWIIPACAGSTMKIVATVYVLKGSSPHARGALGTQGRC